MATPVMLCDTERPNFFDEHDIETFQESPPSMFRFNSNDSLKTISVGDISEESYSDSIARLRREEEYRMMSKQVDFSPCASFGHTLSMDETPRQAEQEKGFSFGDWGQLINCETPGLPENNDASSTRSTVKQDNSREEGSDIQTNLDHANPGGERYAFDRLQMSENMDDVLRCFLMLSKEISTKSHDDDLKSYAAKESELLVDRLVGRGFDKTKFDALDQETTTIINCRIMHSRHMKRLEWLQGELEAVWEELESLSEEVKETGICGGTEEEERKRQTAQDKRFSSKLGKLARTWQAVVENDLYAEK